MFLSVIFSSWYLWYHQYLFSLKISKLVVLINNHQFKTVKSLEFKFSAILWPQLLSQFLIIWKLILISQLKSIKLIMKIMIKIKRMLIVHLMNFKRVKKYVQLYLIWQRSREHPILISKQQLCIKKLTLIVHYRNWKWRTFIRFISWFYLFVMNFMDKHLKVLKTQNRIKKRLRKTSNKRS